MNDTYEVDIRGVHNNADLYILFQLTSDAAGLIPVDLTGISFKMSLRDRRRTIVITMTNDSGITIVDAVNGLYAIDVPQATLATWPTGDYVHDMLYMQDGRTFRYWEGEFELTQGITAP